MRGFPFFYNCYYYITIAIPITITSYYHFSIITTITITIMCWATWLLEDFAVKLLELSPFLDS